jgi:DNA invertase Pin-like site-specific DNA recombinase
MNYAYIRVSTERQTVENQRFEITNFASSKDIQINKWIEETISSVERLDQRKFGKLLNKMKKGDQLIVTESSRMGRNLMQIKEILHDCMEK